MITLNRFSTSNISSPVFSLPVFDAILNVTIKMYVYIKNIAAAFLKTKITFIKWKFQITMFTAL